MTLKDKLELGLKDDAPVRRDNLLYFPKSAGGSETQPGDLTRSPEEPVAEQLGGLAEEALEAVVPHLGSHSRTSADHTNGPARK
jgi:hypothetical protein